MHLVEEYFRIHALENWGKQRKRTVNNRVFIEGAINGVFLFAFVYPSVVEKVLFGGQILEMEILMSVHVMRSPNPKIRF